jgi:hypothetical protein
MPLPVVVVSAASRTPHVVLASDAGHQQHEDVANPGGVLGGQAGREPIPWRFSVRGGVASVVRGRLSNTPPPLPSTRSLLATPSATRR